jgi:hypothetical protein
MPALAPALAAGAAFGAEPAAEPPPTAASGTFGARFSTAQATRWRSVGRWISQQSTEQKTSAVRARLQVETLQTQ